MSAENKKGHLQAASDVLCGLLQNSKSPLSHQFLRWKVWSRWEEIVGPMIAKNSEPVGYARGELFVWVKTSAHMQEMLFTAPHLCQRINKYVGKQRWVRRIRFTLDRKSVPAEAQAADELKENIAKQASLDTTEVDA